MNTHWWRRRRDVIGRPRRQSVDNSFLAAILMLTAGALLTVTTGLWAMQELEQFGPSVGGVVVFRPDKAASEQWSVDGAIVDPIHAGLTDPSHDKHCVLSPSVMARDGGSFVIEARRLSTPPLYRVHWAGGHTSGAPGDCGTPADLVLERSGLMRLANMAGGFRDGFRLIGP